MTDKLALNQAIISFLKDEFSNVLVIRGVWGIGKTYFWKDFVKKNRNSLKQTAYSYVSMFGIGNISEIKENIFRKGIPLKNDEDMKEEFFNNMKENENLYKYIPSTQDIRIKLFKHRGIFSNILKHIEIPYIKHLSKTLTGWTEDFLVKNYLICFDDIERKEDSLSIKGIMGYIDILNNQKNCKIVIIFNQQSWKNNSRDFLDYEKYREKVVDVEIEFSPNIKENLSYIIPEEYEFFETMLNVFKELDNYNIRIFKKTKWAIDHVKNDIKDCNKDLQREVIEHIALFCWFYCNSEDHFSLEFAADKLKNNSWLTVLLDKTIDKNKDDERWNQIAGALSLRSAFYDDDLVELIKKGFLEKTDFRKNIRKENESSEKIDVEKKFNGIFEKYYYNSFEDNEGVFIEELVKAIKKYLDKIEIRKFSSCLNMLEDLKYDTENLIKTYLQINKDSLTKSNELDLTLGFIVDNKPLLKAYKELIKMHDDIHLDIDSVVTKISEKEGWNQKDIDFLSSVTNEDIYNWIKSKPYSIVEKIRRGLLYFENVQFHNDVTDKKLKKIVKNTEEALKQLASENNFNKIRVKNLYNINID